MRETEKQIDWLPEIPANWKLQRVKYLFKERTEKGYPNEYLLVATQSQGVIKRMNYEGGSVTAQKDLHLLKLVEEGDFVISLRSFQGGIEYAYARGIISPAYTIMQPKVDIHNQYFRFLFKSKYFIDSLATYVTGIREGQNIDYAKFRMSFLPLPPKGEQIAIAEVLQDKTIGIGKFVSLRQKTVNLVLEMIFKIVLNGKSTINDSISWSEGFPEHWERKRAKYIFREITQTNQPELELLAVTQDRGVLPKAQCEENFVTPSDQGRKSQKVVPVNSFIISLRSFQGGIELSSFEGIVSPAYNVFMLNKDYDSDVLRIYYKYLFKSGPFIQLLNTIITGIRDGQNIPFKEFSNLTLPIPDKETLTRIKKLDSIINDLKNAVRIEIDKMDSFHNSLINHFVSGEAQNLILAKSNSHGKV